jgi:DNA (cytosine-5)-methyltransferase 3A
LYNNSYINKTYTISGYYWNMRGINVLSLFDGMSCGMLALREAGIRVANYYASEIDKHAIAVSSDNFPDIMQLGPVEGWRGWDLPEIDLIIAGSPCQGFSSCGKGLAFDDPRSALFFEFENIVKTMKPRWFLMENVIMKKEWNNIISGRLGVLPIRIDSSLMTAQNRRRLYWCNWSVEQPEDMGIELRDIVEWSWDEKYEVDSEKYSHLTDFQDFGVIDDYNQRFRKDADKSYTLTPNTGSPTFRNGQKLAMCDRIRKFTPKECERLQGVPDGYSSAVSDHQRYRMLGNGWTVPVIAHILGSNSDMINEFYRPD